MIIALGAVRRVQLVYVTLALLDPGSNRIPICSSSVLLGLVRLGFLASPTPLSPAYPDGLTLREVEVLRLITTYCIRIINFLGMGSWHRWYAACYTVNNDYKNCS